MASRTQTFRPLVRAPKLSICRQCKQSFATTAAIQSGHNKWSKIRHGKEANDAKKNAMRTTFTKAITLYSKLYGPNPDHNPSLAAQLSWARKAGVPRDRIEAAIARGQGKTSSGAALESLVFEAMVPPSVAIIVDIETESKLRALQELNYMVKKAKGTVGSSKFLFSRVGRVVFEQADGEGPGIDEVMDDAIESGAEDIENDEDGNIVVWTQPSQTTQVCQALGDKFGLKVLSSDIIWSANEDTKAPLEKGHEATVLAELLASMKEYPDVQAVYSNVAKGSIADDVWESIEENLDS